MDSTELYVMQPVLTAEAALLALQAAVARAQSLSIKVVVAVVDRQGRLAGLVRMPGAFHISQDLAIKKAKSVAGTGLTGPELEQLLAASGSSVREGVLTHPELTLLRGGLPIRSSDLLVGAVAVSGGSEIEDEECALAALRALTR